MTQQVGSARIDLCVLVYTKMGIAYVGIISWGVGILYWGDCLVKKDVPSGGGGGGG